MINRPAVRLQRGADAVEDDVRAVPEEGGVDADYAPAEGFQGGYAIDVLGSLGWVGPVQDAVVFDCDAPGFPADIEPRDEVAGAVSDDQLCCWSRQSVVDQHQPRVRFRG